MSTIDDLFKEIDAIEKFEPETKPLDINSLFGDIDDAYPTQERLESQEYLKASEEEADFVRNKLQQERQIRNDRHGYPQFPKADTQEPLVFEPETITPSKDESNVLKRIGSGLADIKAGGFSLREKVSIPTASGISEGDPQYRSAVKAENTRGKDILSAIGKVKNNLFSHKDFEFIGTVPTKQSLQPVEDALKEMGKSDAEVKEDLDSVRSYIMRSEQFRRGMEKEHWNKVAEGLYSTDEQIHNIYDRLDFVVNKLPSSGKADEEVLKGFFEGTLEHDISSTIGWAAATNPKRAAKLAREFENVKREIDENSIDHGKAVNFAKEVAKIIGPMSKTMAKGAVVGAIPGVGTMLAPTVMAPDWMSSEIGGIFGESLKEKVAPEDAAGNAILFGIASGLVEQLQVGKFKNLVSAFGKDRFKGLLKEGIQKFIKKRGVKAAQKLAKNFAVQTSQEGIQKAITTIAKEVNVAESGLSEKDVGDILLDGWSGLKNEMIETAPHMAALTAISGLTGLSLGKARRIMNPRVNRSIQSALAEQDLEYTPENVAQVLAEDPDLQARIDENTTLVDQIESARNRSLVAKVGQKKTSPAEIQRIWKAEYNSPISHATAQEKAEILEILQARAEQVGISSQLREETSKKFDEQYEQALAKTEATAQRLRDLKDNLPLMLEDKSIDSEGVSKTISEADKAAKEHADMVMADELIMSEIEQDDKYSAIAEAEEDDALRGLRDSILGDGGEVNKKSVIKYWRMITGDKLTRKEAMATVDLINNLGEKTTTAEDDALVGLRNSLLEDGKDFTRKNVTEYWESLTGEKLSRRDASSKIKRLSDLESEVTPEVQPEVQPEVLKEEVTPDGTPIIDEIPQEVLDDILGGKAVEAVSEEVDNVQMLNEVYERNKESVSKDGLFEIVSEYDPKTKEDWLDIESMISNEVRVTPEVAPEVAPEVKDSWDYIDESDSGIFSLASDFKDLDKKVKRKVIKDIKDDIKTTLDSGFVEEGGNIIMDPSQTASLNNLFNKLTREQNKISQSERDETKTKEAKTDTKRTEKYIEDREGLTASGLTKAITEIDNNISDVLTSEKFDRSGFDEIINEALDKKYSKEEVSNGIDNVINKKSGGEVESDIRRFFTDTIVGIDSVPVDEILHQIESVYGEEIAEEEFLTKDEGEQDVEEQTLFSISKDGKTVRPSIGELHVFEKATKDIEYFIPPELLDKMELEFVDDIVHNGEVVEGADGAIIMTPEGGLKVMIHKDTPLDQQAKLLYHEIMGHAGVSNVINNNSKLHKEAVRLFNSSEAQEKVNELRTRYKDVLAKTKEQFGEDAANDTLFAEWMAHEMHDYMLNRDEQSVGARLWNLFKDWLVSKGWVKAENAEEFMRALTKEMRKVPPSKISTDFNIKYKGPAMAFSLKDRVAGAKKKQKTIAKKETAKKETAKKETAKKETAKKETATKKVSPEKKASKKRKSPKPIKEALKEVVAKERAKKKEAVSKVREKAKETVKKVKKEAQEKIAQEKTQKQETVAKVKEEKRELTQKQREQVKALKEKHKQELKDLRTKINKQHNDREVKIEEFHDSILEYAEKYFVTEKESKSKDGTIKIVRTVDRKSLNELKAYLFRIRPKTAKGLIGAKNRSLKKLAGIVEKKKIKEVKSELIKTIKSMPKEMTTAEKEAFNKIVESIQLSDMLKTKRLFFGAVKHLKESGEKPPPELDKEIKDLGKIADDKLDIEDVNKMVIALKRIIHEAKNRQKEFIQGKMSDYNKLREDIEREIGEGKKVIEHNFGAKPTPALAKQERKLSRVAQFLWGNAALPPDAIISERIVNKENSQLEMAITDAMSDSLSDMLRFIHNVDEQLDAEFGTSLEEVRAMSSLFFYGKSNEKITDTIGVDVELTSGKKITMTPAHRVSFILHSRNEHNRKAVLKEGFRFDTQLGGRTLKITDEDIDIIVKSATAKEKQFADFMHRILNTDSREAFLSTTKAMNGYEMTLVDDYYALHRMDTYKDYLTGVSTVGDMTKNAKSFLEDTGSLQGRQKNATGTVIIEDAFKTFYDSIKLAASYKGYAQRLRTARQVVNDLKGDFSSKYGIRNEVRELEIYLNDIENSVQSKGDEVEGYLKKIYGRGVQGALSANITVIARQFPSYLTAGSTGIDGEHLAKGALIMPFSDKSASIRKKIKDHSPQIWQRITKGTINAELGDRANRNEAAKFFGKKKDFFEYGTIGIEKADAFVMIRLFGAAESEISKTHPNLTGDEKWEKIAKRAEYIIKETQPVYAKEHRSRIGRSSHLAHKSITTFTSVTNQILKSLVKSVGRYRRESNKKKAVKRLLKDMAWIYTSSVVAMMGVDELRDYFLKAKTPTGRERISRLFKYIFAPLYYAGIPLGLLNDQIDSLVEGKYGSWNTDFATSNIIIGMAHDLAVGLSEIAEAIIEKDLETGDYEGLFSGIVKSSDAILKGLTGGSVRNVVNNFIKPFLVERGNPEVITISKGLGYRPFIPRSKTIGRVKYRMMKDAYKDKMRAVHQYVQDAIDRTPDFDEKSDEDKEKFLKREYKTANRAHGGFDMSDMVRIEEDK